ncbi:uncharacterized protein HMPREF1541_08636 [Cyphellophora europaea CBS 101466]|uniref:Uncharacterized protein n=1 Tax=Cyphellophora europaea (strain CBS 101466) TaxID=1220924 RepID=W2RKW1_CYPE1|nr:uncharacterized protein HMPREF1541_08636 [Cyphellophora europaea CBS 101466]ETN36359.1 hypothetical protein HMPREF1541_08636 [Cyphellophora europaea CBS 101466]
MPPKKPSRPLRPRSGKDAQYDSASSFSDTSSNDDAPASSSPAKSTTAGTSAPKRDRKRTMNQKDMDKDASKKRRDVEATIRGSAIAYIKANLPAEYDKTAGEKGDHNTKIGRALKSFVDWVQAGSPSRDGPAPSTTAAAGITIQTIPQQPVRAGMVDVGVQTDIRAPIAATADDFDRLPEDYSQNPGSAPHSPDAVKDKGKGKGKAAPEPSDDAADEGDGEKASETRSGKRKRSPSPPRRVTRSRTSGVPYLSAPTPGAQLRGDTAPEGAFHLASPPAPRATYVAPTAIATRTGNQTCSSQPHQPIRIADHRELASVEQTHIRLQQQAAGTIPRNGGRMTPQVRDLLNSFDDLQADVAEALGGIDAITTQELVDGLVQEMEEMRERLREARGGKDRDGGGS